MNLDWILARGADSRLLPAEKLHAPTVALMAIMTFVTIIVAAAGLALANAAALVASGAENRYVIEIPAASVAQLPKVLAVTKSVAGVRKATAVPEQEMRQTLERWLGEAASSADLPVPALITLELEPRTNVAAIEARARQALPEVRLVAEGAELKPLLASIAGLQWLAVSVVLLMAAAAGAAVVLASRGALDTHRPTVEIMHGIGATDVQVTRLFERKIAVDAIAGAVAGALAALAALLVIGGGIAAVSADFAGAAPLRPRDMIILGLIPLAAVALAVAVARTTLLRALRSSL